MAAKQTMKYGIAAVALAIAIIAIASVYVTPASLQSNSQSTTAQNQNSALQSQTTVQGQIQTQQAISTVSASGQQTSTASQQTAQGGQVLAFLVQLTDPPTVPTGTTSLNLTYSTINMIVAEPGQNNEVTMNNVAVTPQGGSATVDLLKLQNISLTIASANLPANSTIYSVSFTVTGISIEINGTASPVTLATGGNTLLVTLAKPSFLNGTTAALLQLNPVIVNTPTGYQMVPSAVAIIKTSSEITDQDHVIGSKHQLTNQDKSDLDGAKGQVSARLTALSASGTTTTVTVQVSNTGNSPVQLVGIGLHGGFTVQGQACSGTTTSSKSTSTSSSSTSTSTSSSAHPTSSSAHPTSSSQTRTSNSGEGNNGGQGQGSRGCGSGVNDVVFMPVLPATASSSTTSSTSSSTSTSSSSSSSSTSTTSVAASCAPEQMAPVNGDGNTGGDQKGLTLSPGQCVNLTFTGVISFGQSSLTVVPSAASGQTYSLHVIASNGAETMLNCALPLTATSCSIANPHNA
jgi:hypothetical protein